MATEVRVPVQGNDVTECVVSEIRVAVGDTVKAGQPLFDIETAKASYEVESPADGSVIAVVVTPGDEVPVHTTVVVIGQAGESYGGPVPQVPVQDVGAAAEVTVAPTAPTPTSGEHAAGRVPASPLARKMAADHGIDLSDVLGRGPHGRVLASDVLAAAKTARLAPAPVTPAPVTPAVAKPAQPVIPTAPKPAPRVVPAHIPAQGQSVALSQVRKITAQRMSDSLSAAAQFTLMATADARPLLALHRKLKASDPRWGLSGATVTDLVTVAVLRTLGAHPEFNAHFTWDHITTFGQVDLGLAVATEKGLLVPVIRGASHLTFSELIAARQDVVARARAGKLAVEEMTGSTFTISAVGAGAVTHFTPVINIPEVAILGVGGISPAAVTEPDGSFVIASCLHLSLTIDHRALDGAPGAAFLTDLADALQVVDLLIAG